MRIILSPAKQMKNEFEILEPTAVPVFINKTEELLKWMQSQTHSNLQKMWKCNSKIAEQNLASNEYSKIIEQHIKPNDTFITINFCENYNGKLITKGVYAKMARGEMVRFMAENNIENPEYIKKFDRLCYIYRDDISSEKEYVFERIPKSSKIA